jgi:hypothetical protein
VDPLDNDIIYGGKAQRYDMRTGQVQDISPDALGGVYRYDRTAPLVISQVDKRSLYLGSNVLFKTTNGGMSWEIVSPDLSRPNPPITPNVGVFAPSKAPRGLIYSVGLSYRDAGVIWAGTDDGLIWRTADGGKHWANVTPPVLTPWSHVMTIETSRFDDETAYAAVSRFRVDDLHPYIYKTHDGGRTWHSIVSGLRDGASVNVVREDPVRRGLLFAGTENGAYVSFDDGVQWQSLQLNLPTTSVRDLDIHGDDLIVATHGRSFWILDDITPLRQATLAVAAASSFLFRPQVAVRFRHDRSTNTPLPPEVPAGQNPPDGAIIDYFIGSHAMLVTMDILDAHGALVRRYESTDRPPLFLGGLNIPTYWIRPPMVLQRTPGMHRFVWDLRYTQPDAIDHDYAFAAIYHDTPPEPIGATAVPGHYTVRLTVDGRVSTQPLYVRADPRLPTTAAGYAAQRDLGRSLTAILNESYAAWEKAKAAHSPHVDDLVAINDAAGQLLILVDGADRAPTAQQVSAAATLRAQLAKLLK